ncbi:MAG: transporter [Bacilli bacterium]|nr:transporter [Bacilli bacterium]
MNSVEWKKTRKGKSHFSPPTRLLLWPSIIFVAVLTQIPFLITIFFSFQSWNLMRPDKGIVFTGLNNFINILEDPAFWVVLKNTFILTVTALCLCLLLGMGISLLLNRNFFAKGIVRTMFVSPFFIMPAVSGIIWKNMFLNPSFGLFAYITELFGGQPIDWLGHYPLFTIICIVTWQWAPFFMLVLLAGLQSVSKELMEAAMLDGATKLNQFFHVTIPHLLKYIEVATLLGLIFIMQTFGEIYVATSGGPGYASTNLAFYVYRIGFQGWDVGGASALGVIIVILTLIFMTFLFRFLRKIFKGELS